MRTETIDITPQLLEKLKATTVKVLQVYEQSGLTDPEIFLALSMTLHHYEQKFGVRLNSLVGIKADKA